MAKQWSEKSLAKARAQNRKEEIARKQGHVIKAGANLPSQWGQVVTNEQRLIDNGHYMKTGEGAKLDYMREQYRKAKKAQKPQEVVRVRKA